MVFFTAILLSNQFSNKRISEIRSIQDQISLDILSSEVQSSLLEQFSCKEIGKTALSKELGDLGTKLAFAELSRGDNNEEVLALKRNYSLLQIKDFLLMNKIREKCGTQNIFILYFYSKECDECEEQGLILTKLKNDFPELRVYSFDYNLGLGAIETLISINNIKNEMPALLINDEVYYGLQNIDNISESIPELKEMREKIEEEKAKIQSVTDTE